MFKGETGITVKFNPELATPPTVTTTFPLVAPAGTGTAMVPELQLVGKAAVPLKLTVLDPCVDPKLVPAIVTNVPTVPAAGERLRTPGATVKLDPLLAVPFTVTTTLPVVAPGGTVTTIEDGLQPFAVATVPLNDTELPSWSAPKLAPEIVTDEPTAAPVGAIEEMFGPVPGTVKFTELL